MWPHNAAAGAAYGAALRAAAAAIMVPFPPAVPGASLAAAAAGWGEAGAISAAGATLRASEQAIHAVLTPSVAALGDAVPLAGSAVPSAAPKAASVAGTPIAAPTVHPAPQAAVGMFARISPAGVVGAPTGAPPAGEGPASAQLAEALQSRAGALTPPGSELGPGGVSGYPGAGFTSYVRPTGDGFAPPPVERAGSSAPAGMLNAAALGGPVTTLNSPPPPQPAASPPSAPQPDAPPGGPPGPATGSNGPHGSGGPGAQMLGTGAGPAPQAPPTPIPLAPQPPPPPSPPPGKPPQGPPPIPPWASPPPPASLQATRDAYNKLTYDIDHHNLNPPNPADWNAVNAYNQEAWYYNSLKAQLERQLDAANVQYTPAKDAARADIPYWTQPAPEQPHAPSPDPSTPTGQRGGPMDVRPGTNAPTTIDGRSFSGHALDQMQGRGIPVSVVENALQTVCVRQAEEAGQFSMIPTTISASSKLPTVPSLP
ncbi:hypothetical protein [Mycobacterium persicum]|uniref:hypothetical protein n=1 Tax=Mycobacterium persicum TaxID=1487726 RepID=UPI0015946A5F|nr:hypothetical protein [Mycobacterium persicum]